MLLETSASPLRRSRREKSRRRGLRLSLPLLVLSMCCGKNAAAGKLPPVSDRAPLAAAHFPDAVHAVVWRNWRLVEPARLAEVLGTTEAKVRELAASMGLPAHAQVSPDMATRGYITLLRRNWHLLPYDQMLQLLSISEEELAFRLREDDFLYIKLGSLKPACPPVKYSEPTPAARQRAAEIREVVQQRFGELPAEEAEPRFAFLEAFRQGDAPPNESARPAAGEAPRFIYSYCGMFGDPLADPQLDPYPDGLLSQLAARGVNGVWLHTVLRQLAPGAPHFPEFGAGHEQRLANLRSLVQRADQYGIDVYLYVNEPRAMPHDFFEQRPDMAGVRSGEFTALCTSDPRVRQWLSDSLAYVFREVPGLGGVFTITASENLTNCASHGGRSACSRCAARSDAEIIAEVNAAIAEGVHRSAPRAKAIAYDWGWNGHGDARNVIDRTPASVWIMSVSEWALPIERGGVPSAVGEYSISAVGPGPRASLHWKHAKQRGLKTIAKVQLSNTWELASTPYLPVLDLVAEHCARLAQADVDGMMLSWSLGGYPSANLELAGLLAGDSAPDVEAALNAVATRHFGPAAAAGVRRAWSKFSAAFRNYPYHGEVLYNAPQQVGPANLLYAEPTGYSATMVGLPYDDLDRWRGPYPREVFAQQFEKLADEWSQGLVELRSVQPSVPAELRDAAQADYRVAEAAHIHFASVAKQARLVMARDALASAPAEKRGELLQAAARLLDDEIELARRLYELASADSRLGYEASNHYFYVPLDLVEKVVNSEHLKSRAVAEAAAAIRN
ncbi:MAG: hypothetical protein DCC67_02890 [Planctomycetota bacterium]|nr:MAG: hypothetical protein DCC67_02890 [Planctomycetota bacterium]